MKILILNTDYPGFLDRLYRQNPGLERRPYEDQMRARNDSLFGVADFYSHHLRALGHEAWDVHANNPFLQQAWAREHPVVSTAPRPVASSIRSLVRWTRRAIARTPLRCLKSALPPSLRRLGVTPDISWDILAAQIRHYRPDVLLNHDPGRIGSRFLLEMRPHCRFLVAQIASPLAETGDFHGYDLVISSLPQYVDRFRQAGIRSDLLRFAFDPRVLERVPAGPRTVPVSFVGSLSCDHRHRAEWLERLCQRCALQAWGPGVETTPKDSWIRRRHQGIAWGVEMYAILGRSRITLNHHIGIAEHFANNMRLFEATGMGALLITDWKQNLGELFDPGTEVAAYRSADECAELIEHYLGHPRELEAMARAGQQRTLREHTYAQRMKEFVDLVQPHI